MALVAQSELARGDGVAWHGAVYEDLAARLSPPSDFPCTFSQNAFRRGLLQLSFVDAPGAAGFAQGAADLADYVAECRGWDGRVDSAKPLLMVFSGRATAGADTLEAQQALGWQALHDWHRTDPAPWPEGVSTDPEAPFWSFCYAGMQLFVNMSCPAHVHRQSRNLGRHLTLVVNPRERFDVVAGATPEGAKLRAKIRARSALYDGMAHSDLLGSYQKGELEWVQYALPDDNSAEAGRCPFRFRGTGTDAP